MKVRQFEYAIYDRNNRYGPIFGAKAPHDFYIADNAGSNTVSYANLGLNYIPPMGYRYGSSATKSLLAGTYNFQPDDYEILYKQTD